MDRFVNKKIEKQTIYEIYRACRLCGAGGGYKMPIIQNVVNLDNCDVELKQKIRECVQIEVHQDDKMPPLICELCVDKVNDFYEFLEMCRQTNKRTRLKLGLPPQMLPRGAPDAGDCILGVTEPIFVNDEDSNEPLSDKRNKAKGGNIKKNSGKKWKDVKIKVEEKASPRESRSSRQRAPSPPRLRRDKKSDTDYMALSGLQSKKRSLSPPPKSILKKVKKPEASPPPPTTRPKRSREKDSKQEAPAKRVKISLNPVPSRSTPLSRQQQVEERKRVSQREVRQLQAERRSELRARGLRAECTVCGYMFKTPQAMMSHRRCHVVTFTNPKVACNACEAWFPSEEQAVAHHRRHERRGLRYRCRRCGLGAASARAYDEHIQKGRCHQLEEVPDVKCGACGRSFPTENLLQSHRCAGERGPGKCRKCGKAFSLRNSLTNHVKHCKKGEVVIPPELRRGLKPLRVRVAKCDPLLVNPVRGHYDVSNVETNFGLDSNCVYPYLQSGLRIKREPADCMVKINAFDFGSYVHWDSEDESGDSDDNLDSFDLSVCRKRNVKSLSTCALRTIFSPEFLGKVPRKLRRLKIETIIDSTLNDSLSDLNLNDRPIKISDKVVDKRVDENDDDLFPMVSSDEKVTNADFDSLFSDNNGKTHIDSDKSAVSDKLAPLGDKESDKSENVNESDDLISGAKERVDEENNVGVKAMSNNDVSIKDSTSEIIDENIDKETTLDSGNVQSEKQSDINTNDSEENMSHKNINNDGEETTDDSHIKDDENTVENIKQVISNEAEQVDTNKSEELLINHDSETHNSTESKTENNDINKENVSNNEKLGKCAEKMETEAENSVSSSLLTESDTEHTNKETKVATDHNNIEGNIDNINNGNGDAEIDDVALHMNKLEDYSGDDFDDRELMAELDAQIGEEKQDEKNRGIEKSKNEIENDREKKETEGKSQKVIEDNDIVRDVDKKEIEISEVKDTDVKDKEIETNVQVKDKILLEDLLPTEDVKSMDLDSISDDEFDFND